MYNVNCCQYTRYYLYIHINDSSYHLYILSEHQKYGDKTDVRIFRCQYHNLDSWQFYLVIMLLRNVDDEMMHEK